MVPALPANFVLILYMKNKSLPLRKSSSYKTLVRVLKKELTKIAGTGSKALTQLKLTSYWNIGHSIAAYGELPTQYSFDLAKDLGVSRTALYRCRSFFECWQSGVPAANDNLSWTHYIELIRIADKKLRAFYFEQALKNGWTPASLARAIKENYYDKFLAGEITIAARPDGLDPFYVYKAIVERVIDGDTIDVRVDLGFHTWTSLRIRLRGINCAEIESRRGGVTPPAGVQSSTNHGRGNPAPTKDAATQFVVNALAGLAFIVIKTHQTDIYGRYVADVYFHPTLTSKTEIVASGMHLNQLLLDKGLAKPMLV